jgi:bacterial/archaeal transporter family-2 protein
MMDRGAAVLLTAAVGGLIALQAPFNARLGTAVGDLQAAFLSFLVGTAALLVLAALARGGLGTLAGARHVSWYYLTGGVLGGVLVIATLITVRTIGAGGITAALLAGQLTVSIAVDHFGWLGVERSPVTPGKVAGILLLGAGTYLVIRD